MEAERRKTTFSADAVEPQGRLVVRDGKNVNPLSRFLRAMILDLLKVPSKVRSVEKLDQTVAIDPINHKGSGSTINFSGGKIILQNGVILDPDIKITCDLTVLMKLARMPVGPAAINFLRRNEGKDVIKKVLSGELKIKGITRHPLRMMRFARFIAPVPLQFIERSSPISGIVSAQGVRSQ
jgi:hypothetical protein